MTHTYSVSGMTCTGCQAKVQQLLSQVPGVQKVAINLQKSEAAIDMEKHVPTTALKAALQPYPKYTIEEKEGMQRMHQPAEETAQTTWLQTFKPLLILCAYILGVTL